MCIRDRVSTQSTGFSKKMDMCVAFDGSLHSIKALEKAIAAFQSRANSLIHPRNKLDKITILHVQPTSLQALGIHCTGCEITLLTERQYKIFAKKTLVPAIEMCKALGISYRTVIKLTADKTVSETIADETSKCDLLFIGKLGCHEGDVTNIPLGTTSSYILENAQCPVYLVNPPEPLRI
eukprot:TRINITY_DN572_c0_g1_i1.p1 TRINITY_DN572_c0_g1~~TRINITY_DN572_c0_g1_i1.p1  ORF type:complete len:180 (-),score=25.61 TRINITY_DN572_c0_g1_i1:30-569(-)